jgi:Bacterial HORMA domain family 1
MSYTYTQSFTRTHARHLASKVVADLYQCSLMYDRPSAESLPGYEEELVALLADGYVESYEFGFKRDGRRVLSWHYTVGPAGVLEGDSRSGSLLRGVDLGNAHYFNFLTHSSAWFGLTETARESIEANLPFRRTAGSAPSDGSGYWATEHAYSAGGVLVQRKVFKPW